MQSSKEGAIDNFVDHIQTFQNHIWFVGIGVEVEVENKCWSFLPYMLSATVRHILYTYMCNFKFNFEPQVQLKWLTWYDIILLPKIFAVKVSLTMLVAGVELPVQKLKFIFWGEFLGVRLCPPP